MDTRRALSGIFLIAWATGAAASGLQTFYVERVGVLPFDTAHVGASGQDASDFFSTFLVRSFPGVSVVERSRLERILSEQHLQTGTGLVDLETAVALKRLLGVDSLVIGSIISLDIDVKGGGTLMMTARLVDASSGHILWAETVTAKTKVTAAKKIARFFSDAPPASDALTTSKLLEQAAFDLVQDLGRHLSAAALNRITADRPTPTPESAAEGGCRDSEARITRLGESILPEEALYWANRLREDSPVTTTPGAAYADAKLRKRLTAKIFSWLGKAELPGMTQVQYERLAKAKTEMREILVRCSGQDAAGKMPEENPTLFALRQ